MPTSTLYCLRESEAGRKTKVTHKIRMKTDRRIATTMGPVRVLYQKIRSYAVLL